jgi:hypothetical protein
MKHWFTNQLDQYLKSTTAMQLACFDYCFQGRVGFRCPFRKLVSSYASSFYEHLPAAAAFALAQKLEFHYTPKSAS